MPYRPLRFRNLPRHYESERSHPGTLREFPMWRAALDRFASLAMTVLGGDATEWQLGPLRFGLA